MAVLPAVPLFNVLIIALLGWVAVCLGSLPRCTNGGGPEGLRGLPGPKGDRGATRSIAAAEVLITTADKGAAPGANGLKQCPGMSGPVGPKGDRGVSGDGDSNRAEPRSNVNIFPNEGGERFMRADEVDCDCYGPPGLPGLKGRKGEPGPLMGV
ncbi:hypothetical protein BV898_00199 [Hypsibius exemplaris]|uniref:Uncharacterized protein n=1 Tax=Hypsibius exemplaris TaxID=2072580 RepID=A0A1W0XFD8_HYPEX|nr:hypothetical protein BV898_00199 [Hypsibius exemplaris]